MIVSRVISGEYKDRGVLTTLKGVAYINCKHNQKIMLTPENVASYELLNVDNNKSFTSGVVRGAIGGAIAGGTGALAGVNSAKSNDSFKIKIIFKDKKASLLEVDKSTYNAIINQCFNLDPEISSGNNDSDKQKKTMLERSEERYQKAIEKRQEADAKLQKAKDDLAQVRLQNQNKKIYTPKQVKLFFIGAVAIAAILSLILVIGMHSENKGIGMDIFMFIFCTIAFSIPTLLGAFIICLPSIKKNKKDKQDK